MNSTMKTYPIISIQCDWNDAIRLPNTEVWISSKHLNEKSVHDKFKTSINDIDNKIKINLPQDYHYVSNGNLSLVVKHLRSGLKVAFIAPTKTHKVHDKGVLSVDGAENALVVSSSEDDKLLVWDSRTSEVLLDLKGHGGSIYKSKFFPSGTVIVTAGADGSSRIWSAKTGINPVTLVGHKMGVTDLCIVDKGRNIITVSKDGSAKLWDVGESNCLSNLFEGRGNINCCTLATTEDEVVVQNDREISTGNKLLIVGCESGLVLCAHVAKREEIFCKQLDSPCNASIHIEDSVIIGCSNGKITQLSLSDGSIINQWHETASPVMSLTSLPHSLIVSGHQDGTCIVMSLLETYAGVRVQLTGSDCDGIRDIAFNGKWIFAGCRDCNVRKYDFNQIIVHFK